MTQAPSPKSKINKNAAIAELWSRGELSWKCHAVQKDMRKVFYDADDNATLVWLLARQSGKSYMLAGIALEQCLRKSNSIVKLLTDTKLHAQSIFDPIFKMLLEDCPEHLKPTYIESKFTYHFSNGSSIQLAGSDNKHYERLRGQKSDLVLVDEAGFCDNLNHIVKSILLPTLTHTGGKIVLASTPPTDPDHDFYSFIEQAELNNTLTKKTIYDNPLLKEEQVQRIIKEMGGELSPQFRREYLCEVIREEENVLFPEFTPELEAEIIKEWPKPPFFDTYVSMDLGYKDLTAVLFAYYDFRADKVIIEDEIVLSGKELQLPDLTERILKKESDLWTNPISGEVKIPTTRVSDINYIVTQEIARISNNKITFLAAKKDDNESALNNLRVMLANKKIIINPRCKNLIRHLRNCKWKNTETKTTFARSPDNGHYDTVDAIKYLVRSISYKKNPYPAHYNYDLKDLYVHNPTNFYGQQSHDIYRTIFNVKKK
jgi:phage terminase large subunit